MSQAVVRRRGGTEVERVAHEPSEEERGEQREQRDARKPGGLEHLRRGQRRRGEEREAREHATTTLSQRVPENLQALLALARQLGPERAERERQHETSAGRRGRTADDQRGRWKLGVTELD